MTTTDITRRQSASRAVGTFGVTGLRHLPDADPPHFATVSP